MQLLRRLVQCHAVDPGRARAPQIATAAAVPRRVRAARPGVTGAKYEAQAFVNALKNKNGL